MAQLTENKVKKALLNSYGNISETAKRCKVSRQAIYDFLENKPDLIKVRDDAVESSLDLSESKLISKIKRGTDWAIKYHLSTKGRKRGYGKEITVNNKNLDINKKMSELEADIPRSLPYLERLTKASSMEEITQIIAEYDIARITDKGQSQS